jgi:hypothetical protein
VLPVSKVTLTVRETTGEDELIVLEPAGHPVTAAVRLADRVAVSSTGEAVAWEELPAADLDAIILVIRQAWLGDTIRTQGCCADPACRERMDIAFSISVYLRHHRPRTCRAVLPGRKAGWFELAGGGASFRLPTIGDLQTAVSAPDAELRLRQRCVDPPVIPASVARRISRAMYALAPSMGGLVTARCPACGNDVIMHFDPLTYTLAELRCAAGDLYEQVNLLASAFGWSEREILLMPRRRRARYAALIQHQRVPA